jgi:hypothetical protein
MAPLTQLSHQVDAALTLFKSIDLGKTEKERYGECSLAPYDPNAKSYPTLYLDGDEFADLPESGEAVVKYQVVRRSTDERKGKKRHSLTIEVRSMDPKSAAKAQEKQKAEGKAVPISTEMSALPSHAFARPRDGDGQFVANVTGGADPVTMRQAYGQDPKKSNLLAPGAAAAALGGTAALLGTKAGRGMVIKGAKGAARTVRSAVTGIQRKSQGRSTERYPVMGSKAPKKAVERPGFGETLMRQRMRGD